MISGEKQKAFDAGRERMHGPQGPLQHCAVEFGDKQEIGIAVPCSYTSQFPKLGVNPSNVALRG
jgi:hypothetical protein